MSDKKKFLTEEYPKLIASIDVNRQGNFGLMTPQHMIEHMTWVIKSSIKRYGEPEGEPTKRQLGFKRFIEKGAVFQHRPSDKTKADLPVLKYSSFEEAVSELMVGVDRFYHQFENNLGYKSYSEMMGELGFEDLELFHYMHARFHLWQFGALKMYP